MMNSNGSANVGTGVVFAKSLEFIPIKASYAILVMTERHGVEAGSSATSDRSEPFPTPTRASHRARQPSGRNQPAKQR